MNKGIRNLLIISVCCFFLGVVIMGSCALVIHLSGGYDRWLRGDDDRDYDAAGELSMTLDKDVTKIHLTLLGERVVLQTGAVEAPLIEWEQAWDRQYIVRQSSNGTLTVSREETERHRWGISWDDGGWDFEYKGILRLLAGRWGDDWYDDTGASRAVTITLPQDHPPVEYLSMDSVAGFLKVTDLEIDEIKVNGVSTRALLGSCKVDRFSLSGVDAEVRIEGGQTDTLSADGLNVLVHIQRASGLKEASVSGLNARFEGNLSGDTSDYRFSVEGMGSVLKINGKPCDGDTGWGEKRITVNGMDARIDVTVD